MIENFVKKWGAKKLILSINDVMCTLLAFASAVYVSSDDFIGYLTDITFIEKIAIFTLNALLIVPIFRYYQLYKHKYFLRIGEQTLLILKGALINSIIIILCIFLVGYAPGYTSIHAARIRRAPINLVAPSTAADRLRSALPGRPQHTPS
jgi:hypothetical protein